MLSHRGYWIEPHEKNTAVAFHRSFDLGFGTETDVRDHNGRLVIAHDPPIGTELGLDDMLDILGDRDLPLALNIKADGLGPAIQATMAKRPLTKWFTFDMSSPELIRQTSQGLPAFTRWSDHERERVLYDRVSGVWLDAFESLWFGVEEVKEVLADGKALCVVSPELHGRPHEALWDMLRGGGLFDADLMVCTDLPELLQKRIEADE